MTENDDDHLPTRNDDDRLPFETYCSEVVSDLRGGLSQDGAVLSALRVTDVTTIENYVFIAFRWVEAENDDTAFKRFVYWLDLRPMYEGHLDCANAVAIVQANFTARLGLGWVNLARFVCVGALAFVDE